MAEVAPVVLHGTLVALQNGVDLNPDRARSIPQIVPEEPAPAYFARCGWELQNTDQLEMVLDLAQKSEDGTDG